jgi:putative heme-binding domain-containing protein
MRLTRVCVVAAALLWAAHGAAAQEHSYTPADIENGSRIYQSTCAGCHGPNGDGVAGVELGRGQFRRATSDPDVIKIIQTGIPGTTMPSNNLTDTQAGSVVAYLRTMAVAAPRASNAAVSVGDAARGRALFDGKGECATCHRVSGRGGRLGPDLTDIGATRPLAELQQSIVDPDATIRPGNRFFRASVKGGSTVTGRLLNQDSFSVQLIDASEHLVSLPKANLTDYGFIRTSSMPSSRDKLSPQEVADLVGYLVTLKGLGQ